MAERNPGVVVYLPEPYGREWVRGLGLEPVVVGTTKISGGAWVVVLWRARYRSRYWRSGSPGT